MIERIAYARAGLLGNPSDGYYGKIIAVSVRNFAARVVLEESPEFQIVPAVEDEERYPSVRAFADKTRLYGYYGGVRLLKAAVRKFLDHCDGRGLALRDGNFTLRYASNIPRQLGLGGSSALVTAAMRTLMAYHGVEIPIELLPTLILSAEQDELEINAGFMDRVIQTYEGCVYMDLAEHLIRERGYGHYERLDCGRLPDLYLAYKTSLGKVSGRVLNEIRRNYDRGDERTIATLKKIAALADAGKAALAQGDPALFARLLDENFDLRRSIMTISPANLEMIRTARFCGASASYAGSGGSIIGTYDGEAMFDRLAAALERLGATVIKPAIQ
jgi:glucuronokinase